MNRSQTLTLLRRSYAITGALVALALSPASLALPELEVVVGPSVFNASAISASPLLSRADHTGGRLEAAVSLLERSSLDRPQWGLDLRLSGSFMEDQSQVLGGGLAQDVGLATGAVGVKAAYALLDHPHWTIHLVGQLDLEMVHAWYRASAGSGATATGYAWSFGLQPQAGFEAVWFPSSNGTIGLVARLVAGFAWRTDSAFSPMEDTSTGTSFAPVGTPNFSGVTATFTAGLRF